MEQLDGGLRGATRCTTAVGCASSNNTSITVEHSLVGYCGKLEAADRQSRIYDKLVLDL